MREASQMQRGLKNRHLQMIALGGAIGTGLFYGSASTISLGGPSVIAAYLICGIVIFLIMRMLGEMAVEEPVSGSFSYYADKYWGPFPGFMLGWNYWFSYVIISMAELTAVGIYVHYWLPDLPQWVTALVCLIAITCLNLVNVRAYGETEFWMSFIKVAAILGMIALGAWLILQDSRPFPQNFSNLWDYGGILPKGIWGFCLAMVTVIFSFGGVELIGITAGEAENPERSLPKTINQIIWRILVFYIGTMIVIMTLWPWNQIGTQNSPFVQIFTNVGFPAAANLLNFVVLAAAISVYNSAIYGNSRIAFGLAEEGNAPQWFKKLSSRGVPVHTLCLCSGLTLFVVAVTYFFPGKIFMYFLSLTVGATIVNWVTIIVTHLKFKAYCRKSGKTTKFPSLWYPAADYFCLAFLCFIVLMMTQMPDMLTAVLIMPVWLAILWCCWRRLAPAPMMTHTMQKP